ncbi:protein of unknown function [Sterolibacterium denitrificans]|uniref:Uncharacterized protein n=2 Tax=Sterolibacterium denitrificans TaxID=157592 RepID=A0A7Z7HST7_9PROT|nr:hypothetical protein [Sterolibacterium denitrificans]KYC29377.1 hypothetical protein ACY05_02315 [Sterolibacterium denitrificans]SMB31194.1 protein of unknown function [Sterolibacterium denitrificans]
MTLADYIAQPPSSGETGLALQPFLDTPVYFNQPPENRAQTLTSSADVDWPLEAKRIGELVTLVFYTDPAHRRLEQPCATLPLRECLQISFDFPGADAIALVNPDMRWKSFRKEDFERLLNAVPGGGYR